MIGTRDSDAVPCLVSGTEAGDGWITCSSRLRTRCTCAVVAAEGHGFRDWDARTLIARLRMASNVVRQMRTGGASPPQADQPL